MLTDDAASWPNQVSLRGFIYDTLDEQPPVSARQRLAWLGRDPGGYAPQPYEQLIAVYRRAGRDQDARTVAIAKQRVRRRTLPLAARAWSLLLDALVGYGYRTWLAGVWLLGFVLAGWWIFDRAHPAYLIAPKPPGERPLFHAGLYALDLLLPIGDLNYQGAWIARGPRLLAGVDPCRLGADHRRPRRPRRHPQTRLTHQGSPPLRPVHRQLRTGTTQMAIGSAAIRPHRPAWREPHSPDLASAV